MREREGERERERELVIEKVELVPLIRDDAVLM